MGQAARVAPALQAELQWLAEVVTARVHAHFQPEGHARDVWDVKPPDVAGTPYGELVQAERLGAAERMVVALCLASHLAPEALDVFLLRNDKIDRPFTEFGGLVDHGRRGFSPTGETALFLLAGDHLQDRLRWLALFDDEHPLVRNDVIAIERHQHQPPWAGALLPGSRLEALWRSGPARGLARKLSTPLQWSDIVLDQATLDELSDLKTWIERGDQLLAERGQPRPRGQRSLFVGPAGTGKTLAAALLGKATGREVQRIDLAAVAHSDATEKNLQHLFDEAERKNWILFFDEADALFGKRSDVRDAHDRYAAVAALADDFPGVVIFAARADAHLDQARVRRLDAVIHFAAPGPKQREALWKKALPDSIARAPDLDLADIAARFEVSGGTIVSAVRHAIIAGARRDSASITRQDLERALRRELAKHSRAL